MKKVYVLLISCLLMTVSSQAAGKTIKHTIKNTETLYTIAHKNHTTIEEVRKINGIKKGEILKVGRILTVPTNTYVSKNRKAKNKKVTMSKHSIKNGETLFTIARKHHTTIAEVQKANGLKKGENLKIGRVLKVPTNTYNVPKTKLVKKSLAKKSASKKNAIKVTKHRIKNGETLFTIARKHHTTIEEVRKSNDLKKGDTLKIGRVLKVPTNTYNVPKTKLTKKTLAKKPLAKKKKQTITKRTKKSNKKLAASLSKLESITLVKGKVLENKKSKSFSLSDIFSSSEDSESKKIIKITSLAKKKLGRRYVWGAAGAKNTFDCSGFTKYVFKKNGINIPRTSINQSKHGKYISRKNLKKGDLVFFDTSKKRKGFVNHVGIYLGDGTFIHASSAKKKVVITRLNKKFYANRYKGARRPS